jgi:hypothetical protein
VVIRGITFETESADLSGASCAAVTNSAICRNRYPALKVAVVGHTDNTGLFEFNIDLSERRAQSIAQVLQTDIDVPTERLARSASAPRPDRHRHDELRPQPEPPRRAGDDRLTPATSRRRQRDPEPAQRRAREGSRDPHRDLDRRSVLAGIDGKQPVVIARLPTTATILYLPPYSRIRTPSSVRSPSSKRSCARPRRRPRTTSGQPLAAASACARLSNAPTSSATAAVVQPASKML